MEPLFTLATSELRRLLAQLLRTDEEFDVFLRDFFPEIERRCGWDTDRAAKTSLLFESVDRSVLSGRLRTSYPDAFAFILMIEMGSDIGRQYPLPRTGSLVIGRGTDADIRLSEQDAKVSRRQALITLSKTEVLVEKLGKLPIYIEGREVVTPLRLYPGNALEIHNTVLRLHDGSVRANLKRTADPRTALRRGDRDRHSDPESMPAAKESANKLFWGLSDRLLEMNRIDEAERMMAHRLRMVLANAELGEVVEEGIVDDFLKRALRLAQATKKGEWLGWLFDYARTLKHKLAPPLLDDVCREINDRRPAIAKNLKAYVELQGDSALKSRLEALLPLCTESSSAP